MGAASFLAMRAAKSLSYIGEDISTDKGWNTAMEKINKIIDAMVTNSDAGTEPEVELATL